MQPIFLSCRSALLLSCCVSLSHAVQADTVYTKSGDIISGRLILFQDGLCLFKTRYGASISLPASELAALATEDRYRMRLANGDTASGRLLRDDNGSNRMQTIGFGVIEIQAEAIEAMTRIFEDPRSETTSSGTDSPVIGENNSRQAPIDFLSGSTVLLGPGKVELEFAMQYKQTRTSHSLIDAGYFQLSSQQARQMEMTSTLRAGLWRDVEAWLTFPLTHTGIEQVSTNQYVRHASQWALGDISAGLQYQWWEEDAGRPAVSLSVALSAPTGKKHYYAAEESWRDPLSNGAGHWSMAPGIAFVRSSDPAMLFGGINYRVSRSRRIDGYHVRPGAGLTGYLGMGFAINEQLSLGSRLSFAAYRNMTVDGQAIAGSSKEPLDLSFSMSYRFLDRWTVSPQVTFGLNDEAGPAYVGLRLNRRFE